MDIFGISSAKIILILIIAIILLGPEQVPVMVKTVGKTIRDFRKFVNETTKEFNDVTGDLRKEFTDSVGDLRSEIASTQAELKSQFDFSDVMNPITSALRDPLGTTTVPEAVPIAAGATVTTEANTLAAQTVPYTPPEPATTFTIPEPETPPVPAFASPPEPITVQTPYAESLAASNGTHANGVTEEATSPNGNGGTHPAFTSPRATKADPFADLAVLVPARPVSGYAAIPAPVVTAPEPVSVPAADTGQPFVLTADPAPESGLAAIPVAPDPAPEAVSAEPVAVTVAPRRATVGRSVTGTRYGRKRAS